MYLPAPAARARFKRFSRTSLMIMSVRGARRVRPKGFGRVGLQEQSADFVGAFGEHAGRVVIVVRRDCISEVDPGGVGAGAWPEVARDRYVQASSTSRMHADRLPTAVIATGHLRPVRQPGRYGVEHPAQHGASVFLCIEVVDDLPPVGPCGCRNLIRPGRGHLIAAVRKLVRCGSARPDRGGDLR